MPHQFYWACERCGASPIATQGQNFFESEQQAVQAGAPARCPNHYCHSNADSPYYTTREGGW